MKSINLGVCAFLLSTSAALASSGNGAGNGGDSVAIEMKGIGKALAVLLQKDTKAESRKYPEVDKDVFAAMVDKEVIKASDEKLYDSLEDQKTATNRVENGVPTIRVNIQEYKSASSLVRQKLAFHETLGLMGLEGSNDYHISNRLDNLAVRPIYGACQAKWKKHKCSVGIKYDIATGLIEGSYSCNFQEGNEFPILEVSEDLKPELATLAWVKISDKATGTIEGVRYADKNVAFDIPTPMVTGMTVDFHLAATYSHVDSKGNIDLSPAADTEMEMNGKCVLTY